MSLRGRLQIAMAVFLATSIFELLLVGASDFATTVFEGQLQSDFAVQQAYLNAQIPRANEEAIAAVSLIQGKAIVSRQEAVNASLAKLGSAAVDSGRDAYVADVNAITQTVTTWRAAYEEPLQPAADGQLQNNSVTQAAPVAVKSAWQALENQIGAQNLSDFNNLQSVRHRVTIGALMVGLIGLTIGVIVIVLAQRSVMRPLQRLGLLSLRMGRGETMAGDDPGPAGAKELEDVHRALTQAAARMSSQAVALREASEAKTSFIGYLSHELRTPMNAILGMTGSLQMDPDLTPSQQSALKTVKTAGDHLLSVINDVLDLARVEAGQITLNLDAVRVADVVTGAAEVVKPLIENHGITVSDLVEPSAWVTADRRRTVQILINLLGNAIKYGEGAAIEVASTVRPGNLWRISVVDHGPGMPPETLATLFRAFRRGSADRSAIEGTGLGLVLSKSLVEAMGGSIGVASTEGVGTSFWIELPMATVDPSNPPSHDEPPTPQGGIPPELMDLLRVD